MFDYHHLDARAAQMVLDLYQGISKGQQLGPHDYVISADEKTSIQARDRRHPIQPPQPGKAMRVEHEYTRRGAIVYLAALDVFIEAQLMEANLMDGFWASGPYLGLKKCIMRWRISR